MPTTGLPTIADPVQLSASYRMTSQDRRLIDDQIRDLQAAILAIAGQGTSVVYLPVSSLSDIQPGQVVCLDTAHGSAVTVATTSALANAKQVRGIAVGQGFRNGRVPAVIAGAAPAALTRLSSTLWGARMLRVGPDGYPAVTGSVAIGACDSTGTIIFAPIGAGADIRAASLYTSNATPTTILSIADLPAGASRVDVYAMAATDGNLGAWARVRSVLVRRSSASSNVAIVATLPTDPDPAYEAATSSFAVSFVASGGVLNVQVAGAAQWMATAQVLSVTNAVPVVVPAPTIASIAPTSGASAGGTSVVITGTNFTGATAVAFDAVAATSFTVDSATQITAVSPALADGAHSVSVTTAGGTATLPASFTTSSFSFSGLAWELDLLGSNRSASQVVGNASAGGSGLSTRKLTSTSANTIAAGATFNARPSVDWNSDAIWSYGAGPANFTLANLVAAGLNEFTVIMALVVNSFTATGSRYDNTPRIFGTTTGSYFGIGAFNDSGTTRIIAGVYDGTYRNVKAPLAAGTKQVVAFRLTSAGVLGIKVGSGAWQTLSGVGAISSAVDYLTNYSSATPATADCDVERLAMAKVALSDANVDAAMNYIATLDGIVL